MKDPAETSVPTLLCWIMGAASEIPHDLQIDDLSLFELISDHSLAHRFLLRFIDERPDWYSKLLRGYPDWCSQSLIDRLLRRRFQQQQRLRRQVQALVEVASALKTSAPDLPLIVVKGMATHVVTGDPRHIRFSNDIDIFWGAPDLLYETLLRLGYTGERHAFWHEYRMSRDDIHIEAHSRFPVWSYPQGIQGISLHPDRNPGYWNQCLTGVIETAIEYDDLVRETVLTDEAGWENIAVPKLSMALFLRCAHALRHYLEPGSWRFSRLDAADAYDLTRHPDFDIGAFEHLVERFQGQSAAEFMSSTLHECYGNHPLQDAFPSQRPLRQWPVMLEMQGCWAVVEDTVPTGSGYRPREAVKKVGANTILAYAADDITRMTGAAQRYFVGPVPIPDAGENREIQRVIIQGRDAQPIPLSFSVSVEPESLIFTISVPVAELNVGRFGCMVGAFLASDHNTDRWLYFRGPDPRRRFGADGWFADPVSPHLISTRLHFPYKQSESDSGLPVILYVKQCDGFAVSDTCQKLQVIPLLIRLPHGAEGPRTRQI